MEYSYLLQLEFNSLDHMIFSINQKTKDRNWHIGYLVLEDFKRKATLEDFEYLKCVYEDGEFEWDNDGNLIVLSVYTYEEINEDQKDGLLELSSTLVEFKPHVTHRVDFYVSKELSDLKQNSYEDSTYYSKILQWLLSANLENKVDIKDLSENDYNHLFQIIKNNN